MSQPKTVDKTEQLQALLAERILVLDGAMGTQIQALGYDERAVRGERFVMAMVGCHRPLQVRRHR